MPVRQQRPTQTRLPTNPRRKVAPEQRKRVAKACNDCNVRRIKCSGDRPCLQCASNSRQCVYPVVVDKVLVPRTELEELRHKVEVYEKMLPDALLDPGKLQSLMHPSSDNDSTPLSLDTSRLSLAATGESPDLLIKSEKSEEEDYGISTPARLFKGSDGIGRYRGETSGAAFLDQLKQLMSAALPLVEPDQPTLPKSRFFSNLQGQVAYDSPSLNELAVNPFWLPPNSVISDALVELRYLLQDGMGEWASGGVYWWGHLVNLPVRPPLSMLLPTGDMTEHRYLSFYNAVLALFFNNRPGVSCNRGKAKNPDSEASCGEHYYTRATVLMGNLVNIKCPNIGDVASLGVIGLYLIEIGAQDAAYICVTAAIHISIVLGAHRGWVDERGKRIFWSTYIVDRWLCCLLGRPASIADEDILLPLPTDAAGMPPAAGLRANVELSKIATQLVTTAYHRGKSETDAREPESTIRKLEAWQIDLPPILQLASDGLSADMGCCLLHMRCNQLLIIALRPFFYKAIETTLAQRRSGNPAPVDNGPNHEYLKRCVGAARRNIRLANHTMALVGRRQLFHAVPHFLFNAAICIVLGNLVLQRDISQDELQEGIRDVDSAIERMSLTNCDEGDEHPTTVDILQELQTLVGRLMMPKALPGPLGVEEMQPVVPQIQDAEMGQQDLLQYEAQTGESAVLYDELMTWMGDNWTMYNGPYGAYMGE